MAQTIQGIRGMNDVLPDASPAWLFFESVCRDWLSAYGYARFVRLLLRQHRCLGGVGEHTDIVEKEM